MISKSSGALHGTNKRCKLIRLFYFTYDQRLYTITRCNSKYVPMIYKSVSKCYTHLLALHECGLVCILVRANSKKRSATIPRAALKRENNTSFLKTYYERRLVFISESDCIICAYMSRLNPRNIHRPNTKLRNITHHTFARTNAVIGVRPHVGAEPIRVSFVIQTLKFDVSWFSLFKARADRLT